MPMASIAPLNQTLGKRLAKHLLRRTTYSYSNTQIDSFANMNVSQAVDSLFTPFTDPVNRPNDPDDAGLNNGFFTDLSVPYTAIVSQNRKRDSIKGWWFYNALKNPGIQHKMTQFLFNQFTISTSGLRPQEIFDYVQLISFYALGNIKTLAKKVSLDNAMLDYLDNSSNFNTKPNENYAREFMELFTIGKGPQIAPGNYTNYTEVDIVEAAKVLTGFRRKIDRSIIDGDTNLPSGYYDYSKHSTGNKTFSSSFGNNAILGATALAGMDTEFTDFVNMIFAQPATANYICTRLYRFFVREEITADVQTNIIDALAATMRANNYDLVPVLKQLLKSQHFYDKDDSDATDEIIGGMIKPPLQLIAELLNFFEMDIPDPNTSASDYYKVFFRKFSLLFLKESSMDLFTPNSVAGFPAYYQEPNFSKNWFNTSTIIARYKLITSYLEGKNRILGNSFTIATSLDIVDFIKNASFISTPSDSTTLVQELVDYLLPEQPDAARMSYFINDIFLGGTMPYNWSNAWGDYLATNDDSVIRPRLEQIITFLINSPEFQTF